MYIPSIIRITITMVCERTYASTSTAYNTESHKIKVQRERTTYCNFLRRQNSDNPGFGHKLFSSQYSPHPNTGTQWAYMKLEMRRTNKYNTYG
jgi:hypothetical protein